MRAGRDSTTMVSLRSDATRRESAASATAAMARTTDPPKRPYQVTANPRDQLAVPRTTSMSTAATKQANEETARATTSIIGCYVSTLGPGLEGSFRNTGPGGGTRPRRAAARRISLLTMRIRRVLCVVTDHRWHVDHAAAHYEAVIACVRCGRWHPIRSETASGPRIGAHGFTDSTASTAGRR